MKRKFFLSGLATLGIIFSQTSSAIVMLYGSESFFGNSRFTPTSELVGSSLGCLLILPLCLLDKEIDHSHIIDEQTILDNGYSPEEVDLILNDFKQLQEILVKKNMRLIISQKDTSISLQKKIMTIYPQATDIFINFYIEQVMLLNQTKKIGR